MMKFLATIALALALPIGAARADAPKDPPKDAPKQVAPKADVDKFIAFFDKLVDIIVADKADCTKMAADINKHIDANQDLLKKASEAKAKNMDLPQDAKDHMAKSGQKMMGAMDKCGQDKGVGDALKRLKI